MRRAALLFNPRAGAHRAKRLAAIRGALASEFALELQPTLDPAHCRALAAAALAERLDALFVLGGDGTLRVVAGVVAGSDLAVGILPGGTTNVVARALGLPVEPLAAARLLARAEPRRLDLGRCGDDVFLMQLSGGLDAHIMAAVDPRLKRRLGRGAVAWTGVREWLRYRFPRFRLELDGRAVEATGFVVANLAEYAGSFRIVPGARPDDGRLDLLLFHGERRRAALGFALDLARERHLARPDVQLVAAREIRLLAPAGAVVQADGDAFTPALPLAIGLAADSIRLLAPAEG